MQETLFIPNTQRLTGEYYWSRIPVLNPMNEDAGLIKEIMVDVPSGRVAYVVLSVGGSLGMGDRLFAISLGILGP
jgi:hypothetical protein